MLRPERNAGYDLVVRKLAQDTDDEPGSPRRRYRGGYAAGLRCLPQESSRS